VREKQAVRCSLKNDVAAELLVGYTAGTLDPAAAADFDRHLGSCPACRAAVAQQRVVWSALEEWHPAPVSADFDARLYQRMAAEEHAAWWRRVSWLNCSWRPAIPVVAAAAVLIGAFLLKDPDAFVTPPSQNQPSLQIEQRVEHALDDMDLLTQIGVESAVEKSDPSQKI
jgi:anti-sigma factor RsiW